MGHPKFRPRSAKPALIANLEAVISAILLISLGTGSGAAPRRTLTQEGMDVPGKTLQAIVPLSRQEASRTGNVTAGGVEGEISERLGLLNDTMEFRVSSAVCRHLGSKSKVFNATEADIRLETEQRLTSRRGRQLFGKAAQFYTVMHNSARRQVAVRDLRWSPSVAAAAQAWAKVLKTRNCALQHGGYSGMGQNLAWSSGTLTPGFAVQLWLDEKPLYTRAVFPGGCNGGWEKCGHYTQIVWRKTTSVGCGFARCRSGATVVVCNYSPPGNYIGQLPY